MSKPYHISIEQLRVEGLQEVFDALEGAFNTCGVDFYLVGALARDVWFAIHGIKERRATRDIDLAVLIATEQQFMDLKIHLTTWEGFTEAGTSRFTLLYRNRIQIDLMPFGAIEAADRTVRFRGMGLTTMSTQGLEEMYRTSQLVAIGQGKAFKVSSLPGLVILKLIAWEDRPELRSKDAQDVLHILENYFEITEDDIYDHHNDLFDDTTLLSDIAARVLGRHIGKILADRVPLQERMIRLLAKQTESEQDSALGEAIVGGGSDHTVGEALNLLRMVLVGMQDPLP